MDNVIICRCEEVAVKDIKNACQNGMSTPQEIKMATRLGMGICQGRMCRDQIESFLNDGNYNEITNPTGLTIHKPVRPVSLYQAANEEE